MEAKREQARQHELEMKIWVGYGCDIADVSRVERSWQTKVCRVCSENQSHHGLESFCSSHLQLGILWERCNAHPARARLLRTLYLHEAAGPDLTFFAPLAASESVQLSESGSRHSGPCPEHHSFIGHCDSCPISDLTPMSESAFPSADGRVPDHEDPPARTRQPTRSHARED